MSRSACPVDYASETLDSSTSSQKSVKRTANWINHSLQEERRKIDRSGAAFPVTIVPVDEQLMPREEPVEGTILNFSAEGVCLEHLELIVEPYVRLSWEARERHHEAIVRLKWCRSTSTGRYLTGGIVVGID
ncbi:MAG: hypothetical protein KDA78_00255 [Planctomycetaceae bacterium]|nr:hypothetical protein [Planctomycetaceae bacterium]